MLEELFCAHRAELTAYCRGLCRSDAAAQDMVQEVFLRAWQNIGTLQDLGPSQRRAWLYRTARSSGSPFIEHALPTVFTTVCGAPSVYAGGAGGPGAGMVQYVQNKYFFQMLKHFALPVRYPRVRPCKNKQRRMPHVQHQNYYRG